ncbi:hypothetical protein Ciccas_007163 [Cichlidogyrus casuarinus]|uniref:PUMA/OVT1 coiled-coil region domain-containing protein n=1 Tax=Cichlidogyrus casuarinus TaxID=1844966 RepID=A0ABD2Q3N7_9PLAT
MDSYRETSVTSNHSLIDEKELSTQNHQLVILWQTLLGTKNHIQALREKLFEDRESTEGLLETAREQCSEALAQRDRRIEGMCKSLLQLLEHTSLELSTTAIATNSTFKELRSLVHGIRESLSVIRTTDWKEQVMDRKMDPQSRQLYEETQAMHQALKDIANAVISEPGAELMAEPGRRSASPSYSTNNFSTGLPIRSSTGLGRSCSPIFVGSSTSLVHNGADTFSTVQNALNKRALQVTELSVKLANTKDQLSSFKKQLEDSEHERRRLEHNVMQLREDLDTQRREREEACRESERCKNALHKMALSEQVTRLQSELERSQSEKYEWQRKRDTLEHQLQETHKDFERSSREYDRSQRCVDQLEQKLAAHKEEMVNLRESLHKANLSEDILKNEQMELRQSQARLETLSADLNSELAKRSNCKIHFRDWWKQEEMAIYRNVTETVSAKVRIEEPLRDSDFAPRPMTMDSEITVVKINKKAYGKDKTEEATKPPDNSTRQSKVILLQLSLWLSLCGLTELIIFIIYYTKSSYGMGKYWSLLPAGITHIISGLINLISYWETNYLFWLKVAQLIGNLLVSCVTAIWICLSIDEYINPPDSVRKLDLSQQNAIMSTLRTIAVCTSVLGIMSLWCSLFILGLIARRLHKETP